MTTLTAFVTAISQLDISGVTRVYNEPPASLNTADLPAMWVQLPQSDEAPLTFQANGGWPILRAQLIVAYQATVQGTQAANWSGTLAILDAAAATLQAAVRTLCKGPLSWSVKPGMVHIAQEDYWAVVADLVGNG